MGPNEYVLGTSDHELARLELQHEVWRAATDAFLDRLELPPGARCLDLGCGPGFVALDLRARVGEAGEVVGVDESPRWVEHLEASVRRRGWGNVKAVRARIEELEEGLGSFDLVLLRWVLAFLPEPAAVLRRVAGLLAPGGRVAVVDYNHEGVSLFPPSEGFRAAVRATRALYASRGGDTFLMGRVLGLFRDAGLEPELLEPHVIAGPPGSPAFRWADAFFPFHVEGMRTAGLLTTAERDRFAADWEARKRDPNALFFSPIVVGASARRPSA